MYLFLLAGPHRTSAPGLFRSGLAALAETSGTTPEEFAALVAVLIERGLVVADLDRRVVFLPDAVEDDPPDSGKVVASWRVVLDELPLCPVKIEAWRILRRAASAARDRAEAKPRRKGEELAPERWEDGLGPEPGTDTPSDTLPDTPSTDTPSTDTPSDTQNTPSPSPSPKQSQSPIPTASGGSEDFSSLSEKEGTGDRHPLTQETVDELVARIEREERDRRAAEIIAKYERPPS